MRRGLLVVVAALAVVAAWFGALPGAALIAVTVGIETDRAMHDFVDVHSGIVAGIVALR